MSAATDLDAARERNLRVWTQYAAGFEARDLDSQPRGDRPSPRLFRW